MHTFQCLPVTLYMYVTCFSDLRLHPSSTLACSCAVAIAGAQLLRSPLFLHLSTFVPPSLSPPDSVSQKAQPKFTIPLPVVSALAGGQLLIGKLRFREFCFVPLSGSPFPEQIKILANLHSELGYAVQRKVGVSTGMQNSIAYCTQQTSHSSVQSIVQNLH